MCLLITSAFMLSRIATFYFAVCSPQHSFARARVRLQTKHRKNKPQTNKQTKLCTINRRLHLYNSQSLSVAVSSRAGTGVPGAGISFYSTSQTTITPPPSHHPYPHPHAAATPRDLESLQPPSAAVTAAAAAASTAAAAAAAAVRQGAVCDGERAHTTPQVSARLLLGRAPIDKSARAPGAEGRTRRFSISSRCILHEGELFMGPIIAPGADAASPRAPALTAGSPVPVGRSLPPPPPHPTSPSLNRGVR